MSDDSDDIGRQLRRFKKGDYYTIGGESEDVGSPPRSFPMLEDHYSSADAGSKGFIIFDVLFMLFLGAMPLLFGAVVIWLGRS